MSTNVYNHGAVHVRRDRCSTCIFRAGNPMHLNRGRVRSMVDHAKRIEGVIPCHETVHGQREQELVCRGFYDLHRTPLLQVADRMGVVEFDG